MSRCHRHGAAFLAILTVLALPASAQEPAPADTTVAAPDTLAVAPFDTVPLMPGVDWSLVTGADADSLLLSGMGVVIAFEDTFSFDPGTVDTTLVSARRVTIGEVIEAIGRRMDDESSRMKNVEFTNLTTVVERKVPTRTGDDYKITEVAMRHAFLEDLGEQSVQLWERKRTVVDGEVTEDEIDQEQETSWEDVEDAMFMAMPFTTGSGDRYNYTITGRELVGNDLIYRIDFKPKSRFEALPSGTVWVDYSHFVIRKLEARMTDVVPFPMFLKGIPVFRLSRERFGEYWFTTAMHMEIELHKIPFADMPRLVEIRSELRDITINGRDRSPDSRVPRVLQDGNLDPSEFWMEPAASEDSLKAYWAGIAGVWEQEMTGALQPISLTPARIDSLTFEGKRVLADMKTASPWTAYPRWLVVPGYNRVQGPVVRVGATVRHRGPVRPRLDLTAGYAFSNQRPEFGLHFRTPLIRGKGSEGVGRRGRKTGVLELDLKGWKEAHLFAGDDRRHARSTSAFIYGSDPNQYLESRGTGGRLTLNPGAGFSLWGDAAYAQERALDQTATFNLLNRGLRPSGNWQASHLDDRIYGGGASWEGGPLRLEGTARRHRYEGPDFEEAYPNRSVNRMEFTGGLALDWLDPVGNQWILKGNYRGFDGQAPIQWKAWLGDYGTLRGYQHAELGGDQGVSASFDARLGLDLFKALHFPVLKHWGIQPLAFADYGQTWHEEGPLPAEGVAGERWDVGFGFGKRLDIPFAWNHPNLRTYIARPVGDGSDGHGWRFLVAFEK